MSYKTKDQLLMQELWRKAFREGVLELTFPEDKNAHRARMLLYNAVKREKAGQIDDSAESLELVHAAESVEIVFGKTRNVLRMQRRADNPIFKAMGDALGKTIDEVQDLSSQASLDRILKEAGITLETARPREEAPPATPSPTPAPELRPEDTPFIPPMPGKKNPFY